MPNPRLAARYAKSVLDLAVEKNQLDAVYSDMQFLQSACKGSRDLVAMLKSPVITADKKGKVVNAILEGRVSVITSSFIRLLLVKGRESYLPEILTAFIDQYKVYKGIHVVKLTTATPVGEDVKNVILEKVRGVQGMQQIELDTAVDEALIGGFVLEIGDQLVDLSVAYELNNIRKQFQNNDFIYKIR
jgi:F-type H+-transporting ATPase subunit delta